MLVSLLLKLSSEVGKLESTNEKAKEREKQIEITDVHVVPNWFQPLLFPKTVQIQKDLMHETLFTSYVIQTLQGPDMIQWWVKPFISSSWLRENTPRGTGSEQYYYF